MKRATRVLLGPVDVAGEASALAAALDGPGCRPTLALARRAAGRPPAFPALDLARPAERRRFALAAPFRFDVLHLFFGRTFLHPDGLATAGRLGFADLRLARALGRRIFMTLQGCDARDPRDAADGASPCREGACGLLGECRTRRLAHRRALVGRLLPLCDGVFCLNPDLAPRAGPRARFLPYAGVDVARAPSAPPPRATGPVRIVHAPTDRGIKGTRIVEEAVRGLASSRAVEFTVVEGAPRREVLARLAAADLAIDQARVGWYGAFAVEAMSLGRPVAAFIRDADLAAVPRAMRDALPIQRIRPDSLADDLSRLLDRRAELPALGAAARAFARTWHDPVRIAREVREIYRITS